MCSRYVQRTKWRGPGQRPPRKGRPAALVASSLPQRAAGRERGEGAKRHRGRALFHELVELDDGQQHGQHDQHHDHAHGDDEQGLEDSG